MPGWLRSEQVAGFSRNRWLQSSEYAGEEVRHVDLRIAGLDALGHRQEAQALRWEAFGRWLRPDHLRPYL